MSHVSAHRSVCYSWDFIRVLSVTLFKPLIETSYREDRAEGQAPGSLSEASLWGDPGLLFHICKSSHSPSDESTRLCYLLASEGSAAA